MLDAMGNIKFTDIIKKALDNVAESTTEVLKKDYGWHFVAMNSTFGIIYLLANGECKDTTIAIISITIAYLGFLCASKIN